MSQSNLKNIAIAGVLGTTLFSPGIASAQSPMVTPTREIIRERVNRFVNSRAFIGSGKLTSKSGLVLTVDKDGQTYTINTDSNTQLRRRFWGKSTLDEIQVGDLLNINGKWTNDNKTTIQATLIRDLSIQKRWGVFIGNLSGLNGNVFTLNTINRGNQTVTLDSNTKLSNRRGQTISQSDLQNGHRIRVKGMWDRNANTITEVSQLKNFSLPTKISPTPSPTITPTP